MTELEALLAPYEHHRGPLPEHDNPIACVFDAGVEHAVNLLADELGVKDWERGDGTEEYDGDLGITLMNIVSAALPKDQYGDPIRPQELRELIATVNAPDTDAAILARVRALLGQEGGE